MSSRRHWTLIGVLLAPAVVLPPRVPLYDHEDPTFLGFPFFYWFQFLLILVAVAVTVPAFWLSRQADRLDRVRHGLTPDAGDPTRTDGR